MMRKILIMLIASMSLAPAFAQRTKKDIVYLKSGGIIKGQLIFNDLEKVKINSAGNEWVFKCSEIDSISKKGNTHPTDLCRNYFFDTSIGVLAGNSSNEQNAPFSMMASFNYRIYPKLYVGVGLGAEFLAESYMPAFAQLQYKFRNTGFTPFVNMQVGYEVPFENGNRQDYSNYYPSSYYYYPVSSKKLDAKGGILFNPSLGFQRFQSENFGWYFAIGYRYHELDYHGEKGYKLETEISRLSLKIGFIFN